jgi:hypothetical protein
VVYHPNLTDRKYPPIRSAQQTVMSKISHASGFDTAIMSTGSWFNLRVACFTLSNHVSPANIKIMPYPSCTFSCIVPFNDMFEATFTAFYHVKAVLRVTVSSYFY